MMKAPDFPSYPLVYIAGPYTNPDPVENTRHACDTASGFIDVLTTITPVIPHLTMMWHLIEPRPVDWWYAYDLALLARCDALYRMDGASTGADAEVEYAETHGIPVFTTLQALARWVTEWRHV